MAIDTILVLVCGLCLTMTTYAHGHDRPISSSEYEREERLVSEINEILSDLEELEFTRDIVNLKTFKPNFESEENARQWLAEFNRQLPTRLNKLENLSWNYETNITKENSKAYVAYSVKFSEWQLAQTKVAHQYLRHIKLIKDYDVKRQLKLVAMSAALKDEKKMKEKTDISTQMTDIYGTSRACDGKKCYVCEPGLEDLMATSRDYDKLLWAWKEWRHVTGSKMRPLYERFVELLNEGARDNDYPDMSEYWSQSNHEQTNEDLEQMVDALWVEVKPMYEQLHAYVRRKLKKQYPMAGIKDDGTIPAHLLGNMWAQEWNNIFSIVTPYPEVGTVDVTAEMVKQDYTPLKMFATADAFFSSIGLPAMTRQFWERSMIVKPADRDVQCHGSASDFSNGLDYRIKMCTRVNMDDLKTVHHEMGHVEYYMAYKDQPVVYRQGANAAFHEAIGDTIALSVMTPEHFREIKLLNNEKALDKDKQEKMDINFLMSQALFKIAFLPFGLLMDKWRWGVFKGEIDKTNYNQKWWELRLKYQGLSPPVPRSEKDFDPGAKYHIPSNTPYIRYFISFLVQFQFQSSLCEAAGVTGPLHRCDIYHSKKAGELFQKMLKMGCSRPWPEALKVLTGQTKIDSSKIKKYFEPLMEWLKKENGDNVGWNLYKL